MNKKVWLALIISTLLAVPSALWARELKVLTIGNSFSICVGRYLPQIGEETMLKKCAFEALINYRQVK